MKLAATVTTDALAIGDRVMFSGQARTVTELADTGRLPVFGTGTEWNVTLDGEKRMVAATSQKWNRV